MLQIKEVSKVYRTGSLVQQALDHVSLDLRDNEFVAILGQSGSGKTTLLNIIGGLDRYDEGDLVINGVSTKRYSDRNWDAYRNHSVGFVFQSYNLIPHQTILANVELALTIGGVTKRARRRRAAEALKKVGLGEHLHKKPSQLSGGQMQRVAIARALVNNPEILLADEPTGALDSETSIQVMELLREVAEDRLVVMVTHNPELAEQYATRIVTLRDGVILADSDPVLPEEEEEEVPVSYRRPGRASMSFLTALLLSFNNLWTKKTRTVLVAFAGSIGIIGIAMILSMSNGVDRYIQSVEEETLQSYPLQITDSSFDLSSFVGMGMGLDAGGEDAAADTAEVRELQTVTSLFSRVSTNDLAALRAYLESGETDIYDDVQAIEYDYNLTPQIYTLRGETFRQVNPDNSFSALGFSSTESMSGLLSAWSSTDSFHPMPASEALYTGQYEVMAGHWPEAYNECVLVLSGQGRVTDMTLYALGLKDPARLEAMVRAFSEGVAAEETEDESSYAYTDFLGLRFRLVNSADYYVYDEAYGVWTDRSGDVRFLRALAEAGEELQIVGVVQPKEDASSPVLSMGIGYPASLTAHLMEQAAGCAIVRAQLADPGTDVFTGEPFGAETDRSGLDFSNLFSVDEEAIAAAFQIDPEAQGLDLSALDLSGMDLSGLDLSGADLTGALDPAAFAVSLPSLSAQEISELLGSLNLQISAENMQALFQTLLQGFLRYAQQDPSTDFTQLPESVQTFLASEEARAILRADLQAALQTAAESVVTVSQLQEMFERVMAGYEAFLETYGREEAEETTPTPETETEDPEGAEAPDDGPEEEAPAESFSTPLAAYLATEEARTLLAGYAQQFRAQFAALSLGQEELRTVGEHLAQGYEDYAQGNGLPALGGLRDAFSGYLQSAEAQAALSQAVSGLVDTSALEARAASMFAGLSGTMSAQISAMLGQAVGSLTAAVSQRLSENLETLMESMQEDLLTAFTLDPEALADAFTMTMDSEELRDLMTSLLSREETSYEGNLRKLGYASPEVPASITIYPTDFAGKLAVKEILDGYSAAQRAAGAEEKAIVYTDVVDTLMSSVTDIVDAISYVLIAFVAISLVVSSVMIGVITYISVLERNKEIGILRAIGASRRNISAVFNAETFIIGALAGVFGIVITQILLVPANSIIRSLTGQTGLRAALPPLSALLLILLSIALTLIGGIIPSRKAARSDPVAALRSE